MSTVTPIKGWSNVVPLRPPEAAIKIAAFRLVDEQDADAKAKAMAKFIDLSASEILRHAKLIAAAGGLDLALRALHQAADDLRSASRKGEAP